MQSFDVFTIDFDIFHADGVVLDILCDRLVLKDRVISLNTLQLILTELTSRKELDIPRIRSVIQLLDTN